MAAEIEFRHLRYFVAAAEELHFRRAAERLHITQPGLSQAIAKLERELRVRLFIRNGSTVELTDAGGELLQRGRKLLGDLDGTVDLVRMVDSGNAGLVRIGVAHLAEPVVAPALTAYQAAHPCVAIDRSAMVSERLLEQLADRRLDAVVIHRVPTLTPVAGLMSETLRRGRLAMLVGQMSRFAQREMVKLSELSEETLLVNPRSLAPGAFDGLKLMCSEYGGFDAKVMESAVASTVALDTDWRPIRNGTAIAIMAETTARAVRADGIAVVPIQPPPQYVLALVWRQDELTAAAHHCLAFLRRYRDRHSWIADLDLTPLESDRPTLVASDSWRRSCGKVRRYAS